MADSQVDYDNPALAAAANYEKYVVRYTTRLFAAILLEHAVPQPGEHLMDIASGTGIVARLAAPRVGPSGKIVAVDLNPAMLEVGRSLSAPDGAVIEWRQGNAQALPAPDETFDLALCCAGLQFFADRPAALREMFRVLKPGGRVVIGVQRAVEHNPASHLIWGAISRSLNTTIDALIPAFSLGNAEEFRSLIESAGFTDVALFSRSFTVREPYNPHLLATILASIAGVVPVLAAMELDERNSLAQAIQAEIGSKLAVYIEGDAQLYPMSSQIAVAIKP